MARNSIGKFFKVSSFGESHGDAVGVLIDGCPSGITIDTQYIQNQLNRRRPGQSDITTTRNEADEFQIISGVFEGKTTGAPVLLIIQNTNQKSADYSHFKDIYRPSHADFTYDKKYSNRDYRGGGRSSARITAGWVAAGAIAELVLKTIFTNPPVPVAWVSSIYDIESKRPIATPRRMDVDANVVRCPDSAMAQKMIQCIENARSEGDSLGGIISCVIPNMPIGLGEPVFGKMHAELGHAMLNINAVKGVEFGEGFSSARMKGSEHNDPMIETESGIQFGSNHSGGLQGGISNGENIEFRVAFKPVASIQKNQNTVNRDGKSAELSVTGRHDPCVLPRAVPIIESLASIVVLDLWLENNAYNLNQS